MKKTLVRIVAVLMLAAMILSVIPAFASGFVGTISQPTSLYKKASTSSEVLATVSGTVTIHYQNNAGTMYQVSLTHNGKSYTGWVNAGAVSNIGRSSGTTNSGSMGYEVQYGNTTSSGIYTATLKNETNVYGDNNKLVGIVKGNVTVNYRNGDGSQVYISANGTGGSVSGWVAANSLSSLYNRRSGSMKVSDLPVYGTGSSATGAYTPFPSAKTGISTDSTIYVRPQAKSSTSGATKIRNAKGLSFTLLGESGDFYYASYGTATGFVRKRDFTVTTGTTGNTNTNTNVGNTNTNVTTTGVAKPTTTYSKAKTGTSTDSTIYMRYNPDKSTAKENVVVKVTSARGVQFTLLGESGTWYLARYTKGGQNYEGYVRMQDFTVVDPNAATGSGNQPIQGAVSGSSSSSGATSAGSGSSSEKWGSFSVPGGSTYTIYGNYYRKVGNNNYYYYATKSSGSETYDYLHTTTALGSQIHVVMGHNMRKSGSMFHRLHHVQNAILGVSKCEGCGGSCGSSYKTTTISASLDGYRTWDIALFYEIPKGSSTSILPFNSQPWNTSTSNYLSTQLSYAKQSGLKGWVNPNVSLSNNGKYMMLITCGDKYESSSNATSKLYMLLKARG